MQIKRLSHYFLINIIILSMPVHAYIGPGAGAGTIAVVLGVIASIVLAFFAIIWYPVKRYFKNKTKNQNIDKSSHESKENETDSWTGF